MPPPVPRTVKAIDIATLIQLDAEANEYGSTAITVAAGWPSTPPGAPGTICGPSWCTGAGRRPETLDRVAEQAIIHRLDHGGLPTQAQW